MIWQTISCPAVTSVLALTAAAKLAKGSQHCHNSSARHICACEAGATTQQQPHADDSVAADPVDKGQSNQHCHNLRCSTHGKSDIPAKHEAAARAGRSVES
jgi:hypothetical protein